MTTPTVCPKCSAPLDPGARFCSSCGTTIAQQSAGAAPKPSGGTRTCTVCGQRNDADAVACVSCGSQLQKKAPAPKASSPKKVGATPFSFFQSWKFTVIAGVVLVGILVVMTVNDKKVNKDDPHGMGKLSPGEQQMIDEIQRLEKHLEGAPNDAASLLRLANLLQDVHFYDKAVDAYERYLKLDPKNADALVDCGTTYFAFSFADTSHRNELIALAQQRLRAAIAVNPKHQLAYFNLGIILFHGGTPEEAMNAFRTCIAIDSSSDAAKKARQFLAQRPITN